MARNQFNLKRNHAELCAADTAIAPLLVAAKITTISVDGKDVAASDAPLSAQIAALGRVMATGDKTEDSAALISANGELAAQVEAADGKRIAAEATVASHAQKIIELSGQLTVANDSITTLTAKNLETSNLLASTTAAGERLTKQLAEQKTELAKDCLAVGCLVLTGADGKPLAVDASEETRLTAALALPHADLSKSYKGALHAAASKVGVDLFHKPAEAAKPAAKSTDYNDTSLSVSERSRLYREQKAKAATVIVTK